MLAEVEYALFYVYPAYRSCMSLLRPHQQAPGHSDCGETLVAHGPKQVDPAVLTGIEVRPAYRLAVPGSILERLLSKTPALDAPAGAVSAPHRWLCFWLELVLLDVAFAAFALLARCPRRELTLAKWAVLYPLMMDDAEGAAIVMSTVLLPFAERHRAQIGLLEARAVALVQWALVGAAYAYLRLYAVLSWIRSRLIIN